MKIWRYCIKEFEQLTGVSSPAQPQIAVCDRASFISETFLPVDTAELMEVEQPCYSCSRDAFHHIAKYHNEGIQIPSKLKYKNYLPSIEKPFLIFYP